MSESNHRGALILKRHFVRKAMGLEIELEITPEELGLLWGAHQELHLSKVEMGGEVTASNQKDKPQEADIEVDGESMDTDWDEPATDWMTAKKAAVRSVVACLMNDAGNLPQVGRRVDRIVRQVGTADIYFDDGSFVSATVSDSQPRTNEGAPAKSCGCKKACTHKQAVPVIDMVAAVHKNQLLGAMDVRKHGARDPRFWGYKVDGPFELHRLTDVPMDMARALTDFPTRMGRLRNPRHAWTTVQGLAEGRPFKRVVRPRS
jgi:hypothetical protein